MVFDLSSGTIIFLAFEGEVGIDALIEAVINNSIFLVV